MKRLVVASALVTSLFAAGVASAETDNALFPSNNASAQVTFYETSRADGAPLATVMVNNSPFAAPIDGVEAATQVTVVYEGESYRFPLAESGKNKHEVWLVIPDGAAGARYASEGGTISLGALMDALSVHPSLLEEVSADNPEA